MSTMILIARVYVKLRHALFFRENNLAGHDRMQLQHLNSISHTMLMRATTRLMSVALVCLTSVSPHVAIVRDGFVH